ncbi:phosphate butyryltransferase [Bacillus sp. RG28]|uniref:Phosphate butyryltransferase n=1 Tax=Gottfriedia endophytica TaxID=2820819 RepID=A0A940NF81_9BACI|nr:phosphate butyryltransferase [Gottfriedia endophytica]MBP0724389.1 phosphate butyryltransferase [Gottfriedia endophytica]
MKFTDLIPLAKELPKKTISVAVAEDLEVKEAITLALEENLANFLLFGNEETLSEMYEDLQNDYNKSKRIQIVHASSNQEAAKLAVEAVNKGNASIVMKGNVPTATLLKEVLNKEYGLRNREVLSHVAMFEIPTRDKLVFLTDAAMNIAPTLQQKALIIENSVEIARKVGISLPKVAVLSAVEVVNPAMQATIDAAALTMMNVRGQIKNCLIDGPLALDNAVSMEAAEHKGLNGVVAGNADILMVPSIESGNVLYKSFVFMANAKVAAVIAGAKAPIVLTSRSDSAQTKLYSLALAICSSNK